MPAIQFGNNGNSGNDSNSGNNAKEQPWIAKLCTENAPLDQNIRRAISCLGPPSIKATPHTLLTNNNLPFPPILTFWPVWPVWQCVPSVAMCYLVPCSLGPTITSLAGYDLLTKWGSISLNKARLYQKPTKRNSLNKRSPQTRCSLRPQPGLF